MASILEQFVTGEFEIVHNGNTRTFKMAEYTDGLTEDIILDEDKLVEYLKSKGILKHMLHQGLRADIISQRAVGKPANDKDGNMVNWSDENLADCQDRIRKHLPSAFDSVKESKSGKKDLEDCKKLAKAMLATGLPTDQVKTVLKNTYKNTTIALALNELED